MCHGGRTQRPSGQLSRYWREDRGVTAEQMGLVKQNSTVDSKGTWKTAQKDVGVKWVTFTVTRAWLPPGIGSFLEQQRPGGERARDRAVSVKGCSFAMEPWPGHSAILSGTCLSINPHPQSGDCPSHQQAPQSTLEVA